jgi:hypothetical protein
VTFDVGKLSVQVGNALEHRSSALAAGLDPAVRPADVTALAAVHPPVWHGVLSADDARIGQSLVHEALAGLEPRIQTNMPSKYAAELLSKGGRIGNLYDYAAQPGAVLAQDTTRAVDNRAAIELRNGYFGSGTTIYGTVHFADVTHTPLASHAAKQLRYADRQLDLGSVMYGDASVVLGDRALKNASFLPADSGVLGGIRPLRTAEHLDDVVFERLVENFQLGRTPERGLTSDTVFPGEHSPAALATDFRSLLHMPREKAVAAIREHLTSSAVGTSYMEAQVRVADVGDIKAVHVFRLPDGSIPAEVRDDYLGNLKTLDDAGKLRGIPIRYSTDPVPKRRPGGA